jgi:hypothetical protein
VLAKKVLVIKYVMKKYCDCPYSAAERIPVRQDKIVLRFQCLMGHKDQ